MSSMRPAEGAAMRALGQPPSRLLERGLRLLDLVLGGLDRLGARRQPGDGEIGLRLADHRASATSSAVWAWSKSACVAMPRLSRSLEPRQHALGLLGFCALADATVASSTAISSGRLPILQIGELRLGLRERGFGLRDRDLGVAVFQLGDRVAGLDAVAAPHRDRLDLRHLDRRQQHVLALDIADGERRRPPRRPKTARRRAGWNRGSSWLLAFPGGEHRREIVLGDGR